LFILFCSSYPHIPLHQTTHFSRIWLHLKNWDPQDMVSFSLQGGTP
jgi:hypothetical protein